MAPSTQPHPHTVRRQIADGLVAARRRAGLTQRQLGDLLDLTTSAIRHRERARHPLRVDELHRYARAMRSTIHQLLIDLRVIEPCPDCPAVRRPAQSDENPGPQAGASVEGSATGDRSTLCDSRGDASHSYPTADREPAQ